MPRASTMQRAWVTLTASGSGQASGYYPLVSRYETLVQIGTGAMASVHLGRVRLPDGTTHPVALKRAHAHVRADAKLAASMMREARLASRLAHPNVVSVLDVDDRHDELVLV